MASGEPQPASWPATFGIVVASLVALSILDRITVPGFDTEVLAATGNLAPSLAWSAMGVVVIRAMLALTPTRRSAAWMLVPVAASAWLTLTMYEALSAGYEPAVVEPGHRFRLLGTLTLLAGAGVVWLLCNAISRTQRLSGTATIGAWIGLWTVQQVCLQSVLFVSYGHFALISLLMLAPVLAIPVVLGTVVAFFGRPTEPFLLNLRLRSALDAPFIGMTIAGLLAPQLLADPWIAGLNGLLAIGITALLAWRLTTTEPRTPTSALLHLVGPVFVALIVMSALGGYVAREGIPRPPPPSPYAGESSFEVVLSSAQPTADADGPRLAQRLLDLGVSAQLTVLDPTHVKLDVSKAKGPDVVQLILPPRVFQIRDPRGGTLGNDSVQDASVVWSEYSPDPQVRIQFDEAGTHAFCQMSTESVDQTLELVLDGTVLSAPRVMEPICGGQVVLTLANVADPKGEAEALARVLRTRGALESAWVLDSVGP